MSRSLSWWFSLLALAFAVAGADKLAGQRGYKRMFGHWGWTERQMRALGGVEIAGAFLLAPRRTRVLGGAVLISACAAVLSEELRHEEGSLGAPRLGLLLAAATALLPRAAR